MTPAINVFGGLEPTRAARSEAKAELFELSKTIRQRCSRANASAASATSSRGVPSSNWLMSKTPRILRAGAPRARNHQSGVVLRQPNIQPDAERHSGGAMPVYRIVFWAVGHGASY